MALTRLITLSIALYAAGLGPAHAMGESNEVSFEELDAAFTAEDAAREAALWSDTVAEPPATDTLSQLSTDAAFIFRGRVEAQTFVYDAAGTPFVRTDFVVQDVVKGEQGAATYTLMQEGGPHQSGDGRVLFVSNSQHFNVGEEELLFLDEPRARSNSIARTQVKQRFRILENKVYTEDGHGVIMERGAQGKQRVKLSRDRHPDQRFREIRIGKHTLQKNFGSGERRHARANGGDRGRSARIAEFEQSIDADTFIDVLAQHGGAAQ